MHQYAFVHVQKDCIAGLMLDAQNNQTQNYARRQGITFYYKNMAMLFDGNHAHI